MTTTTFQPGDDLIFVEAIVRSARCARRVSLAFDTGSSLTTLTPDVVEILGYSAKYSLRPTTVRSAIGSERGYLLRVARFEALGFALDNFLVNVLDLPDGYGVEGLLGLNFLQHFNYEIRSEEGRILTDRV